MSSFGPGYSAAVGWPSTTGAVVTCGMAVVGTIEMATVSVEVWDESLVVVVIGIEACCPAGSVVSVLVTVKVTVVVLPGSSGP
jgi:hypothetical protein